MKVYPTIISFDDFSLVFKSISKEKADKTKNKRNSKIAEENELDDKDTLNINFSEFKDALMRISCLAKQKLNEGVDSLGNKNILIKNKSRIAPQVRRNDSGVLNSQTSIRNKSKSPGQQKELSNALNTNK